MRNGSGGKKARRLDMEWGERIESQLLLERLSLLKEVGDQKRRWDRKRAYLCISHTPRSTPEELRPPHVTRSEV